MIRFVAIGDQISEDAKDFAFFDTVTSTWLNATGTTVFHSRHHFRAEMEYAARCGGIDARFGRAGRLIPEEQP